MRVDGVLLDGDPAATLFDLPRELESARSHQDRLCRRIVALLDRERDVAFERGGDRLRAVDRQFDPLRGHCEVERLAHRRERGRGLFGRFVGSGGPCGRQNRHRSGHDGRRGCGRGDPSFLRGRRQARGSRGPLGAAARGRSILPGADTSRRRLPSASVPYGTGRREPGERRRPFRSGVPGPGRPLRPRSACSLAQVPRLCAAVGGEFHGEVFQRAETLPGSDAVGSVGGVKTRTANRSLFRYNEFIDRYPTVSRFYCWF